MSVSGGPEYAATIALDEVDAVPMSRFRSTSITSARTFPSFSDVPAMGR